MPIGKFNRYPLFQNESYTVDAGGGVTDTVIEQWNAWAEINDRSGNTYNAQSQDLTAYNYRVRVRFDSRFKSTTKMIYEGQVCTSGSVSIETEGLKRFMVLQFSRTDTFVDIS
jgi:SPP1 family predicted phage head-tail adaptor